MDVLGSIYGTNLAVILGCMIGLWLLSLALKNASIADIFWGLGFVILAWLTFFLAEGYLGRQCSFAYWSPSGAFAWRFTSEGGTGEKGKTGGIRIGGRSTVQDFGGSAFSLFSALRAFCCG